MSSRKKRGKKKKKKRAAATKTVAAAKVEGFDVQEIYQNMKRQLIKCGKTEPDSVDILRLKYQLMGKKKWWFIMEECLAEIGKKLVTNDYVFVDGFIDKEDVQNLKEDVKNIYDAGQLRLGVLAGGKAGKSLTYTHEKVRGDVVEWFDGSENFWKKSGSLQDHLQKCDTFVSELSEHIEGLDGILNRSKAMVTCYPGNGARYVKHTDNNCKFGDGVSCNGRRLTVLTYLNDTWKKGDGGELRVYGRDGESIKAEVEPVAGRILLFWSDFRVPHEVLPTYKERFAVTLWYFDKIERARAISSGITDTEEGKRTGKFDHDKATRNIKTTADLEDARIRKEVEKMEQIYGPGATLNVNIGKDEDNATEKKVVDATLTKKKNSGISFVRIGIEENDNDGDDQNVARGGSQKNSVDDNFKKLQMNEKDNATTIQKDVAENEKNNATATRKCSADSADAYKMLEAEADVWELDD